MYKLIITIRNSAVVWSSRRPDYFGHMMESQDVADLKMTGPDGDSAFPGKIEAIKKIIILFEFCNYCFDYCNFLRAEPAYICIIKFKQLI
ncbi:hypothetical protein SAMN05443550_101561 [Pedobacter hartonius]|uniref:Uncharacterized protein n=1 Tax=Pedobacter hartonius TaxID=425514 RepID=A0A1H3XB01_9SPHI|nr:hypothetical protein SAMN05443550_101561 [Pedobacter hartonius]